MAVRPTNSINEDHSQKYNVPAEIQQVAAALEKSKIEKVHEWLKTIQAFFIVTILIVLFCLCFQRVDYLPNFR